MLNNLDRDHHKALPRQRQIQSSAARQECVRLLQIPARHCLCFSCSVGQFRNQHFMAVKETAFVPENLPTSSSSSIEKQLFPLSTRCSNSK